MAYARRVDRNHREIADALRSIGWVVCDTSALGAFVDLVAVRRGVVKLIEVKDGSKCKSQQALTPAQVKLHAELLRAGTVVEVVTSIDDALAL